jgi:hypothetical protein
VAAASGEAGDADDHEGSSRNCSTSDSGKDLSAIL